MSPPREPEPQATTQPDAAPDARAFAAPWQAQAFALTLHLHQRGVFTWSEWAEALSAEVRAPDAAPDGSDYYGHWLAALEQLLIAKGLTEATAMGAMAEAWQRAAHATPHGQPILLSNGRG